MIWLLDSSGGLAVVTLFAAALLAAVVWTAVWLAVAAAAVALELAVRGLQHVRGRGAQSATR